MARTVQQQINIGNASSIYMSNKLDGGGLHGGLMDKDVPNLIFLVRQALEWLYALDPTSDDVLSIGNYLIAICPDAARAEASIVGGGFTPTVVSASSPERIEFYVSASSYIITGASSKNIPEFVGYNLEFERGNIPQSTLSSEPTYFTWNRTNGNFTCSPAAVEGELFALIPV